MNQVLNKPGKKSKKPRPVSSCLDNLLIVLNMIPFYFGKIVVPT